MASRKNSADSQSKDSKVYIAVMGATGSGKSTFINLASQSNLKVSSKLESCTQEVTMTHDFELGGKPIVLIDTPGSDDSERSNVDVFQTIVAFLEAHYRKGKRLHGVIYLHRISDVRIGGVSKRSFDVFRELCGDKFLENVVIATTMWSGDASPDEVSRENDLMSNDKFFKIPLGLGATLARHENTVESAHKILSRMINKSPMALGIQRELVDKKKNFEETSAGKELNRELSELLRKHMAEVRGLAKELDEAKRGKDKKAEREIMYEKRRSKEMAVRIQKQAKSLRSEYRRRSRKALEMLGAGERVGYSAPHNLSGRRRWPWLVFFWRRV